jgi:integrase
VPNSKPDARPKMVWVKVREDALQPIKLHECRHTYASMLVAAGVDLGEVVRRVGHSTITMTMRYTHGLNGSEADTAAKLQAYIDRSRGIVAG